MIFDCSGYSYARDLFKDLFSQDICDSWPMSQPAESPPAGKISDLGQIGQNDAYEHCLV